MSQNEGMKADPVEALSAELDKLLAYHAHLARQWQAAVESEEKEEDSNDQNINLEHEVALDSAASLAALFEKRQKISQASTTTLAGLLIKIKLLDDVCYTIRRQWESGEAESDDSGYDPEKSMFSPPSVRQNVKLAERMAASLHSDAQRLLDTQPGDGAAVR